MEEQPPMLDFGDTAVLLDLGRESTISTPSFSISPSPWDTIDWQRKASSAELPYTPSYASFNSPASNLSGLSAPFDGVDDEFDFMLQHPYNAESPYGNHLSITQDEDEAYNPMLYSTGEEGLSLIEEHFSTADADNQSGSPHIQVTEDNSHAFGLRSVPDQSPASSPGEVEQESRSRASSVSSFHSPPSHNAPPEFNDALANLNFGSPSDAPESRSHSASPFIAPITISADAPSPPPSSTTSPATPSSGGTKPLGRPLIIPSAPPLTNYAVDNVQYGSQPFLQATGQYSSYLRPPQDPSVHLAPGHAQGGNQAEDGGGPSIHLIPSTPISAGGGTVARPPPYQQHTQDFNNTQASQPLPSSSLGNVPSWNIQSWSQGPTQPSVALRNPEFNDESAGGSSAPYNNSQPYMNPSWNGDSLLQRSDYQANHQPTTFGTYVGDYQSQSTPFSLGHRPRAASHSGFPARPNWQDANSFPGYPYQAPYQQTAADHVHASGQGTVNPNALVPPSYPSPFAVPSLDSLVRMSPDVGHASLPGSVNVRVSNVSTPSSPFLSDSLQLPNLNGGPLRRSRTTGSPSSHRYSRSEDIGRRFNPAEAFIKSITSSDGSLVPPDPRSPPPGSGQDFAEGPFSGSGRRGRRGSSSSVGSDRGSPYSRPASVSPHGSRNASPMPNSISISTIQRPNVTTPATGQASQNRRKNRAPFTCPVEGCGSTFTRQFNLKGHLRSHREERPYVCKWPKCGKGFARQHDCKRHEALHLNIRPFTCEGCGKTFARMDALNRHHKSEGGMECRRSDSQDASHGAEGGDLEPSTSSNPNIIPRDGEYLELPRGWTSGPSYIA